MAASDKDIIHIHPGGDITIRHGEAEKIYDPIPVRITGQITAPGEFYLSRRSLTVSRTAVGVPVSYFDKTSTVVLVDRRAGTVELRADENNHFGDIITGKLELSDEYTRLKINSGESMSPGDLGKLLRLNRFLFNDREEGLKIVSDLMEFKATVTAEVEASKDTRGAKKNLLKLSVDTNIPLKFKVNIPIFKGSEPVVLEIEIALDSRGHVVDCYLESPEAWDIVNTERNKLIDANLKYFKEDGITVIEL